MKTSIALISAAALCACTLTPLASAAEPLRLHGAITVINVVINPYRNAVQQATKDEIVFIVHPSNPVTSLTWSQISDMHTGKITNWKQVGGKDLPITVYADAPAGGTRAMVKKFVMGGNDYSPVVKSMTTIWRIAEVVPKDEGGIGGLGKGFTDPTKMKILKTQKFERPLGFITIGEPNARQNQIIEAYKTASK